jgi:raffinose/stachyose/melibiose transport system permease protein
MATMENTRGTNSSRFVFDFLLAGTGKTLLHTFLLIVGFVYIFPFIWMVGTSLKTPSEFFNLGIQVFPAGEWQWDNFRVAWEEANFSQYFLNTVFLAVTNTTTVLFLTSMAAFALSRLNIPGKKYILGAITVTFFLPQGYTILPVFQIVKGLGMLNTLWAVVLVMTAGSQIFNTFLFYGYMRTIPHEIEEAAIIDGASVLQRYFYVVLPMVRPMMATVGLFVFMNSWNAFFTPLVFTIARPELRTLSVGMYAFIGQMSRDWTMLCAGATISILPIIVVYVFLQRHFEEAFAGAVKN